MDAVFIAWGASAVVILLLAILLGQAVKPRPTLLGILIDHRGRFSLTHFQLVAWSIVVLSLVSGVFWGRLVEGVEDPLGFSIPAEVLGLIGIAAGSAVAATIAKSSKDQTSPNRIAASNSEDRPRLAQIFLLEEGTYADKVIDVTKFQNFIITLVLLVAYVALAIQTINDTETIAELGSLPGFSGTFVTLLGISHAAYIAGKLPGQTGEPEGLTMGNRVPDPEVRLATFTARNPAPAN